MILVTGGTGLLGSHLLLQLVREHEEVVALKRPSSDLEEVKRVFSYHSNEGDHLFKLIDWVDVDLLSQQEVERVMIDIEEVYHCAAMVSFQPRDRKSMIDFNVQSTANVVNACLEAGVKKLVHVSSSSAIGRAPEGMAADESRIWARSKFTTGYAESKFKSEMEVWRGNGRGIKSSHCQSYYNIWIGLLGTGKLLHVQPGSWRTQICNTRRNWVCGSSGCGVGHDCSDGIGDFG